MLAILICLLINSANTNWNAPFAFEISSQTIKDYRLVMIYDTTEENMVLDKIYNILEVRVKDHFIDSLSNDKRGISMIIIKRPTTIEPYYIVQAGYNNEIRFEPQYTFYVYIRNLIIK